MSQDIDYKIILIGNSGIGKTSFFKKLSMGIFPGNNISTSIERTTINVDIIDDNKDKKSINVSLFDTAGQEKFRAITSNYYKGSQAALLIYDISNRYSFDNIETWVNSIAECIGNINESKYVIILIGNKSD